MGLTLKVASEQAVHSPSTGMSPSHFVTRNEGFFIALTVSHVPEPITKPVDSKLHRSLIP